MRQDSKLLWLKFLSEDKRQLLYWVIQENSIEFHIQTNLPYILQTMVCAHTTINLPQSLYTLYKANMLLPYYMMSSVSEPSMSFSMICVTVMCDVISHPWLFFLNKQFIKWGMQANYGSYFITIYKTNETIWYRRKEMKRKKEKIYRQLKLERKKNIL